MVWTKVASTALMATALAMALFMTATAARADDNDPAAKNTLTLKITGLKEHEKGKMACALFWENKGFPRKHRRALRQPAARLRARRRYVGR